MHDVVSQFDHQRRLVSELATEDRNARGIEIAENADHLEIKVCMPVLKDSVAVFPESTFLVIQGMDVSGKRYIEFINLPARIDPQTVEHRMRGIEIVITAQIEEHHGQGGEAFA